MKKTTLKNVLLMLVFAITATSVISIQAIAPNSDLKADLASSSPDLAKTLTDAITLKNYYSANGQPDYFDVYEEQLDELFYHAADTTFHDLYEAVQNGATAQKAIDDAKQQATKGGDPAELKACNDKLTTCTDNLENFNTEGNTLRNASSAFYGHTTDISPEASIPDVVQAFIKYAEKTDVYKNVSNGGDIFNGKKWLKTYFDPTTSPILTLNAFKSFYDQILSAVASNANINSSWNIKLDLTPTNKSINDNANTLITNIGTLKGSGACGAPLSLLSTYLQSKQPNTIKYVASSHLVSPANDAGYFQNLTQNDYKVMIENTMYLLNNITNVLFGNDSEYTKNKQAWFDIHPIIDVGTASNLSIFSLNDTLTNKIKSFDLSAVKNAFTKDHTYELTFVSEVNNAITNRNNANYLKDSGDYPAYINNMINLIESVTNKLFANDSNYKNTQQAWFDKHIIATTQTTRDTGIPNLKDTIDTQLDAVLAAQNNTQPATASSTIDSSSLNNIKVSLDTLLNFLNKTGPIALRANSDQQIDINLYNSTSDTAQSLLDTLTSINNTILKDATLTKALESIKIPDPR